MPDSQQGVLYLISGDKHANVLVTSIYSLRTRAVYGGPIHIAAGDERAEAIAAHICRDTRLAGDFPVTWSAWEPPRGSRGDGYRQKTFMQGLSPFERTVFLDADTIVRLPFDHLFRFTDLWGVTLTQFSTWTSNGKKITGRIKGWTDVAEDDVREMSSNPYPAINTGVIAFDKSDGARAFFAEWKDLTAKKPVFINDELAAQLICWRHKVRVVDSLWNYSAIHDNRSDWAILHMHGKKHVRREPVRKLWLPIYDECVRQNVAQIAEWTPAGDKHLRDYLDGLRSGDDLDEAETDEDS